MRAPARSGAPLPVKRASQLLKSTSSWGEKAGGCQPCLGPESGSRHRQAQGMGCSTVTRVNGQELWDTLQLLELMRCQEGDGDTYLEVDDGHGCAVSSAHDAVEVLQP